MLDNAVLMWYLLDTLLLVKLIYRRKVSRVENEDYFDPNDLRQDVNDLSHFTHLYIGELQTEVFLLKVALSVCSLAVLALGTIVIVKVL